MVTESIEVVGQQVETQETHTCVRPRLQRLSDHHPEANSTAQGQGRFQIAIYPILTAVGSVPNQTALGRKDNGEAYPLYPLSASDNREEGSWKEGRIEGAIEERDETGPLEGANRQYMAVQTSAHLLD